VTHCTSCPLKSTVHVQDSFLGSGPPFSRASNSFQYLEKSSPAWPGAVGGGGGQQRRGPSIIRSALRKLTTLGTSSDHLDKTSKQTRRFGGGSIFRRGNPSQHNPADSLRYRLALKMPPCKSKEFFLGMTSLDDGYNSTTSKSLPQVYPDCRASVIIDRATCGSAGDANSLAASLVANVGGRFNCRTLAHNGLLISQHPSADDPPQTPVNVDLPPNPTII